MATRAHHRFNPSALSSVAHNIRIDVVLWAGILFFGGMLTWLSLLRYAGYNAGMLDLGNMAQAIASVQRGQPLVFTYHEGATSRLAFHVEVIYFLLALPYAVWPDPRLLLILQAALFGLGALPVYRLALRRTASVFAARCLALVYLLYPTAQTSVLFDFHGDTLAMPLLLFALDAADRRAWRAFGLWAALAVSCKFYVAAPVALLGGLSWWQYGNRKVGLWTLGLALAYGLLAFLVIRPFFTTEQTSEAHRGLNYVSFYFGQFQAVLQTWDQRLLNAFVIFGPALLLIWRGWYWLLPGLPIAAAALLSTGPGGAYDYRYHHYATVVPFIIAALIAGVERAQTTRRRFQVAQTPVPDQNPKRIIRNRGRSWRGDLGLTLAIVGICNIAFVDTPLNPLFWMGIPGQGIDSSAYGILPRDRVKDHFLTEAVPPDAPVAASMFLAPHLANRATLYVVRYPDDPGGERLPSLLSQVDYVLADALFDYRVIIDDARIGGSAYEVREIGQVLRDPAFTLVAARDGLLLFQRDAPADAVLTQRVAIEDPEPSATAHAHFGDAITLVEAHITPLGGRRFRATFAWRLTGTQPLTRAYVAVSRLAGVPDARIVHLPTYALHPTPDWLPGQVVRETFDVALPADLAPGRYTWQVGWYDLGHSEAYATDARSRLAGSEEVVVDVIEIDE